MEMEKSHLDQFYVVQRLAGEFKEILDSRRRTDPHDARLHADDGVSDQTR